MSIAPTTTPSQPTVAVESETANERIARLAEYRKLLVSAEQKSQEDFDKTVISLSGGALGVSFIFLKDVIGPNAINAHDWLFASWIAWGASTFCVLASYYSSHLALRHAIKQVDDETIDGKKARSYFWWATAILNALGAVLFLGGVLFITYFASQNLKSKGITNDGSQKTSTATSTAASPPASAPASVASRPHN